MKEGFRMNWNKLKKQIEGFLTPALEGRVEYIASGYRYLPDKKTQCYILVDKKEVFNIKENSLMIQWYQTEQEIKNDATTNLMVTSEDLENVRKELGDKVPEDRLAVIAKSNKLTEYAKVVFKAQNNLYKADFQKSVLIFLSEPIEKCLESDDILLNIFALMDRRVGKKRIVNMERQMQMKHPVVRYFYNLRRRG